MYKKDNQVGYGAMSDADIHYFALRTAGGADQATTKLMEQVLGHYGKGNARFSKFAEHHLVTLSTQPPDSKEAAVDTNLLSWLLISFSRWLLAQGRAIERINVIEYSATPVLNMQELLRRMYAAHIPSKGPKLPSTESILWRTAIEMYGSFLRAIQDDWNDYVQRASFLQAKVKDSLARIADGTARLESLSQHERALLIASFNPEFGMFGAVSMDYPQRIVLGLPSLSADPLVAETFAAASAITDPGPRSKWIQTVFGGSPDATFAWFGARAARFPITFTHLDRRGLFYTMKTKSAGEFTFSEADALEYATELLSEKMDKERAPDYTMRFKPVLNQAIPWLHDDPVISMRRVGAHGGWRDWLFERNSLWRQAMIETRVTDSVEMHFEEAVKNMGRPLTVIGAPISTGNDVQGTGLVYYAYTSTPSGAGGKRQQVTPVAPRFKELLKDSKSPFMVPVLFKKAGAKKLSKRQVNLRPLLSQYGTHVIIPALVETIPIIDRTYMRPLPEFEMFATQQMSLSVSDRHASESAIRASMVHTVLASIWGLDNPNASYLRDTNSLGAQINARSSANYFARVAAQISGCEPQLFDDIKEG